MKILGFLFIVLSTSTLFAQNTLGPHLTAMGNNGVVVSDVWCLQGNPAGICEIDFPTVSVNYIKHLFYDDVSTQALVAVIPYKNNFFGLSFQRYGFTDYNEHKIGVAYAKSFGDKFSCALNLNYHQLKISGYGVTTGFSLDVGTRYVFNSRLILGAFISNPSKQAYNTSQIILPISTSFNVGVSYLASDKVLIATRITKVVEKAMELSMGLDYKLLNMLSLRGGISAKPFKQYAGFGLNYRKFMLDMATTYDANLGSAPQISLGYAF